MDKPFFPKLLAYMISGPVVCMAWEGKDVVAMGRKMLGATNPLESAPGTIRGDFSLEVCVCIVGGWTNSGCSRVARISEPVPNP